MAHAELCSRASVLACGLSANLELWLLLGAERIQISTPALCADESALTYSSTHLTNIPCVTDGCYPTIPDHKLLRLGGRTLVRLS
jgi:hypothetical protein